MCSCSGNCNCNSSTIPRGPQGTPGTAATIAVGNVTSGSPAAVTNSGTSSAAVFDFVIPPGAPGSNGAPGTPGINGKNGYTITADIVDQPDFGDIAYFEVSDTSWMSVNQIIFVGNPTGTSNIGGYYKVTAITSPFNFQAERLNWSIPGVTYVSAGNAINPPAIVQASGTIGATGATGQDGNGIVLIKSITNTLPSTTSSLAANAPFTLTTATSPVNFVFRSIDLCPNDGDVGRITYEVVFNKQIPGSNSANISLDIDFGVSGSLTLPRMEPYVDTNNLEENNKLTNLTWSPSPVNSYMYVKYIMDVQRRGNTLSNIFVNWTASSALVKASGSYHNITTITDLDFTNPTQFLEISIKGFNNTTSTGILARNSRLYVESLRLPQP